MLIDSHSHLNFAAYKNDADEVIKRALDNNIWMINVGSQIDTSQRAVEIAQKHKEGVFAAVGLHPIHLQKIQVDEKVDEHESFAFLSRAEKFNKQKYAQLAQEPKVVAIGEVGLDYYHIKGRTIPHLNPPPPPFGRGRKKKGEGKMKKLQKEIFIQQLELASELDKPAIVHCREAHKDLLEILTEQKQHLKNLRGVVHSFSGRWSQAQQYFELGFLVSFNGLITFARDYDKVILNSPLEKTLVETDCPYLTPVPHRGKRNEPSYVKYVAEKIAELKKISFEEVAKVTTENARELFEIE